MSMRKNILIVGGTSGLGLELAGMYSILGHTVFITGRKDPQRQNLKFIPFFIEASSDKLGEVIDHLISSLPHINTLIYAAGFYQEGRIDTLSDEQILKMINISITTPALLVHRLKNNPGKPLKVMFITSSSQYTPREQEPIYTAGKAGLGMLGNSLALDPEIGKVLVVAPSGMNTPFWDKEKDVSKYLDSKWVAEKIIELSSGPFKYKFAKITREPAKVEVIETR